MSRWVLVASLEMLANQRPITQTDGVCQLLGTVVVVGHIPRKGFECCLAWLNDQEHDSNEQNPSEQLGLLSI